MIFVGYIDKNNDTGPGNVLRMIMNEFDNNNEQYKFINMYTETKMDKLLLLFKLLKLLFVKNEVINIHSFGYKFTALVTRIAVINKKSEFYLTLHGILSEEAEYEGKSGRFKEYYENKKKYDSLEQYIIKSFPHIICVSEKERNILSEKYNRYNNVEVIYNGVKNYESVNSKIEDGRIKCIAGGGIYNRKGIFEMLKAVNYYNSNNKAKTYLDIYGDYESEEILNKFNDYINKNNLKSYIIYNHKVKQEEFIKKLSESNFCLAFSKFDTFNLTILEGMSMGVPAVISRMCGACEVLEENKDTIIIDFDSEYEEEFMEKINCLYISKEKFKNMCLNAEKKAEEYNWINVYKKYKKFLYKK